VDLEYKYPGFHEAISAELRALRGKEDSCIVEVADGEAQDEYYRYEKQTMQFVVTNRTPTEQGNELEIIPDLPEPVSGGSSLTPSILCALRIQYLKFPVMADLLASVGGV
jgi:hypothetical protein